MLARAIRGTSVEVFRRRSVAAAVAAALALTSVLAVGPQARAQTTLNVKGGAGAGPISAQAYLPGDVTVLVGDSLRFTIGADEPHSFTFGLGPADLPPNEWPVSGWTAPPPAEVYPIDLGTAEYDGTAFANTGLLIGPAAAATLTFTKAGTFPFFCEIHPGMEGSVTVVESGDTTTQEEADAAAALTSEALLSQVDAVLQARTDSLTTTDNADSTKTWNVFVDAGTEAGPLPGGGSGYLEIYQFVPPALEIQPGDTVHWTVKGAHTVSIAPAGQGPADVNPFAPAAGSDTYDGTSLYHSGLMGFGPGTPTEYSLKFPTAGVVPFFCALHANLGQVGVLGVGMPVPVAPAG